MVGWLDGKELEAPLGLIDGPVDGTSATVALLVGMLLGVSDGKELGALEGNVLVEGAPLGSGVGGVFVVGLTVRAVGPAVGPTVGPIVGEDEGVVDGETVAFTSPGGIPEGVSV